MRARLLDGAIALADPVHRQERFDRIARTAVAAMLPAATSPAPHVKPGIVAELVPPRDVAPSLPIAAPPVERVQSMDETSAGNVEDVEPIEAPWSHAPTVRQRIAVFRRLQGPPAPVEQVDELVHSHVIQGSQRTDSAHSQIEVRSVRAAGYLRGELLVSVRGAKRTIAVTAEALRVLGREVEELRRALLADALRRSPKGAT